MASTSKKMKKMSSRKPETSPWGFYVDENATLGTEEEVVTTDQHQSDTSTEMVRKDGDIAKFAFADGRYLVYSIFRGLEKIHVRQYNSENNKEFPTKIGITLSPSRFCLFYTSLDEITEAVDLLKRKKLVDFKKHMGGGIYVTAKSGFACVNIRKYFKVEDSEKPTKIGIAVRLPEFAKLVECAKELAKCYPALVSADLICANQHFNQMDLFNCRECQPFGCSQVY